ncbi:MAG: transglutaminase domain-containing protein [Chloroflexota bacterium]
MNRAPARFWDLPSALLLTLALALASQRLVATGWTSDLGTAFWLVLAGTLLGLPLGLSRFRRGTVTLLAVLYSLVVVPFLLAAVLYPGTPWLERMASMGERAIYSVSTLASGKPLEDSFLFQAAFSLIFWSISIVSAHALTHSANFTATVLPSGMMLVLLQVLDAQNKQGVALTALYLFLVLLLLGRMNYARRNETRRIWRVLFSGEAKTDINLIILAGASMLVLAAWLLPASPRSVPLLHEWWQDLTNRWADNQNLTNVFASLEAGDEVLVNEFYGRSLVLGQDAALSNTVYFRIQTTDVGGQERYYWRVRSYDTYENGLWETSSVEERSFTPRSRSLQLPEEAGLNAEFTFKVIDTTAGTLVTPARPIWVGRPSLLAYLPVGDDVVDPLSFRAHEPLQPGEEYLVHAILLEPTVKQMRLAGTDYPAWVTERYLQLPPDLPPAIADLAAEITAGAETPYEKAMAITTYLRSEITYTTHVPPAPAGRDTLAWFLFDYKQGFCNYYATAEVVMLRSLGVPARLTVGFAEGEHESPGWYIVRQHNAHAWPEVYFPGLGWVEFEPTSSEPELTRLSGEEAAPSADTAVDPTQQQDETELPFEAQGNGPAGGAGAQSGSGQNSLAMLLVFFVVIILLGNWLARAYISGALDGVYRRLRSTFNAPAPVLARDWLEKNSLPVPVWLQRQAWLAGLTPLARAYMSVYHALRALRIPVSPALTPAEAAVALTTHLPQAGEEAALLLAEYQTSVYCTAPARLEESRRAAQALRRKVRRARWDQLFREEDSSRKDG